LTEGHHENFSKERQFLYVNPKSFEYEIIKPTTQLTGFVAEYDCVFRDDFGA
jgi:hypothetical protein